MSIWGASLYQTDLLKRCFALFLLYFAASAPVWADHELTALEEQAHSSDAENDDAKPVELHYFLEQFHSPEFIEWMRGLIGFKYEVTDYLDDVGDNVDRFLGDETLKVDRRGSVFKLYLPFTYYDHGLLESKPKFRAYIDMPRTKKRLRLLISSFDETDLDNADDSLNNTQNLGRNGLEDDDQGTSIAAQYLLDSRENRLFQFDLGARVSSLKLNPYGRLRFRHKTKFDNNISSRNTQTVLYERIRHWVWEMRQDFDYQLATNDLVRSETRVTWLLEDDSFELRQRGIVFYSINQHRVRSYFAEGNFNNELDGFSAASYSLGMNWRERLYQDWLFAEIEPRLSWFAEDDFDSTQFSIRFMLEMHFRKH